MHTNYNLIFDHKLSYTVFHDSAPTTVKVSFADKIILEKNYAPCIEHHETVRFEHVVPDGDRNILQIYFTGDGESANKYLKVNSISAQGKKLDPLKNHYSPNINSEWWDSLTNDEQKYYKDIIHINNNAHFGWYGLIEYEYFSAADKGSAYRTKNAFENVVTHMSPKFIYENKSHIYFDWDKDES